MLYLEIKTIGEVAFSNDMFLEEGYRYDIPFDNLMLPYIPIAQILRREGLIGENVKIGFAHPNGYRGLCMMASELLQASPNLAGFIKAYFTKDRTLAHEQGRIRSLQAGMHFYAVIGMPEESIPEVKRQVEGLRRIGVITEEITGEVELSLVEPENPPMREKELSPLAKYVSLDFSATLVTPTCFHAPFEQGDKTYLYIPGDRIKETLRANLQGLSDEDADTLRCSNAYIGKNGRRLIPVPICASVVKLDKNQMRYRLAPGKDPSIVEQDVELTNCFTLEFENHLMSYTSPETEHIISGNGETYDALTTGQTFHGRIYGSDALIRKVVDLLEKTPSAFIGELTEEGYGEVSLWLNRVSEAEIPAEALASMFDVSCVSDVLLLNEEGMPTTRPEDLLKEIEYILKCPGELVLEGRYTEIYKDYSKNLQWGTEGPVVRCLAKGSVLRIRTKNGEPVDLFPLQNCFVGERNEEGYGELTAFPARGQYYRLAKSETPVRYEYRELLTLREIELGAEFAEAVITSVLKSRVEALAATDQEEYRKGVSMEQLLPRELMIGMKSYFCPSLSERKLIRWYQDKLEEEEDAANQD